MKIKERIYYFFLTIVIVLLGLDIAFAYFFISDFGHAGDNVYIRVGNNDMTLQQAIDSKLLNGTISANGLYSQTIDFGHKGQNVLVKVNGTEKSLQQAISDGNLCCSSCNGVFTGYSQQMSGSWHYASDVIITNKTGTEKSLQQAIEDKEFCNPTPPKICYSVYVSPGLYAALSNEGKMSEPAGITACLNKYPAGTWHLPSLSEMKLMYQNQASIPNISTNCGFSSGNCPYWTSTFAWNNGFIWYYTGNFPVWPSQDAISTQEMNFLIRCVRSDALCQ
jgi:hypothetical protein